MATIIYGALCLWMRAHITGIPAFLLESEELQPIRFGAVS